jgi:hypothetical protein
MLRPRMLNVLQVLALVVALESVPLTVHAEPADICPEPNDSFAKACKIGTPGQDGKTIKGFLGHQADVDAYELKVTAPSSIHVTLADLWVDTDISFYETLSGTLIAQAHFIADSRRSGEAMSQMSAPELIVERLEPGSYTAFIYSGYLNGQDDRGYTFRTALAPPIVPQPVDQSGQASGWKKDGYQLGLAIEPNSATQFSMLTFNAFIDPSFTDLFDFVWEIDGKQIPDSNAPVLQMAAQSLGANMFGRHTVKVTAVGARPYPDPDRPHIPPTLWTAGAFEVKRAS